MAVLVAIPVRNPEASDAKIREVRANIFGHPAEVFGDDFCAFRSFENGAQADVAIVPVSRLIFDGIVGPQHPVWQVTAADRSGLLAGETDEFRVAFRPPWEGIDPIETEDVIEPENLKNPGQAGDPFLPPSESVRLHVVPAIERDAPVLAPLLEKGVVLAHALGRRATAPV